MCRLFLISFLFSQQKHGAAEDVTQTLELALKASGRESDQVANQSLLLSYNGASYIAADLAEWLEARGIRHIRGAPFHSQTQGKFERWHQTLKKRILLKTTYYLLSHLVLLSKPKIARNLTLKLDRFRGASQICLTTLKDRASRCTRDADCGAHHEFGALIDVRTQEGWKALGLGPVLCAAATLFVFFFFFISFSFVFLLHCG